MKPDDGPEILTIPVGINASGARRVHRSLMLVTALSPVIGYDKA
jgi:fumarate hydratase class II